MDAVTADDEKPEIHDTRRWQLLERKKNERLICEAFLLFRQNGIEPILIKGWAAEQFYPPSHVRRVGDIDLAVSADDYLAAEHLRRSDDAAGLFLDLHRELRHLDRLGWPDLYGRSRLVDLDGTQIRILSPEDHLRVLCVHWLLDGGGYRDRLWDIYYAVENRPDDFDWERCLNVVSPTRRKWIITAIAIAHEFLGLKVDDLPIAAEAGRFPRWIKRTVEREWKSDVRLQPVATVAANPRKLIQQLRKRIPGNPIRVMIETEADIDREPSALYQLPILAKRIPVFLKGIAGGIAYRFSKRDNDT
jgi:Uncharacterised nucleotidyltransferase